MHPNSGSHSFIVIAFLALFLPTRGEAQARPSIMYAGVAFLSADADAPTQFPRLWNTDSTIRSRGGDMGRALADRITAAPGAPRLDIGLSNLLGPGVVFAFTQDEPTVERYDVPGQGRLTKVIYQIGGELLLADFGEGKQIIGSVPALIEYIDVSTIAPSNARLAGIAERLIAGPDTTSLFSQVAGQLRLLNRPAQSLCRVQVTVVAVDSLAPWLPKGSPEAAVPALQRWIAGEFGRAWVFATQLPLLPYAGSQAVDGRLALRFADSRAYDLRVPAPDLQLQIDRLRVRRVEFAHSAAGTSWLYGVIGRVRLVDPLSGREVFAVEAKDVVTKVVPSTQTVVDEWGAVREALRGMLTGLPFALAKGDREWLSRHTTDRSSADGTRSLQQLRTRCGAF